MSSGFTLTSGQHNALREFLTGQLNPDWDDDHDSWEGAVRDLVQWNRGTASDALSSLDELIATAPNEKEAARMLDEIGFMGFFPSKMGSSVLAWLVELRRVFAVDLGAEDPSRD
ncbi:MAG: hypothetical protein JOZ75_11420 [Candidatus Dormibacteraeota bacterium]|nr:hypothetical protein [Candidatus Dormibacteraeota bacterium]